MCKELWKDRSIGFHSLLFFCHLTFLSWLRVLLIMLSDFCIELVFTGILDSLYMDNSLAACIFLSGFYINAKTEACVVDIDEK